jgi:hypothetical protein
LAKHWLNCSLADQATRQISLADQATRQISLADQATRQISLADQATRQLILAAKKNKTKNNCKKMIDFPQKFRLGR